ncbi:molybdenum cofactor guanylyltransferase [Salinispirillum marinum]|uniref:Molybdenum cofactor guanylyltransferase n=2 Tax=Saccharospirillaceae TaxID=255527 RepID=A0ABV8B997_9GAMM
MAAEVNTVGIVLAGGTSSRMGQDKARIRTAQGLTWAEHAMAVLQAHCATVVLNNADGLADHRVGFAGPLAGIEAALLAYPDYSLLILPVDMPLLTPADVQLVVQHAEQNVAHEDSLFPLKVQASAGNLAALQHCLNHPDKRQRSIRAWLRTITPQVVWLPVWAPERMKNFNYLDEWLNEQQRSES